MKIITFRKCRQKNNAAAAPRQESGQAAIFALLLIPTAIAAMLLVFNTGQLTANKLRVQNAADAAAFSAMELQARQMNIDAYLNRAMLANEVAIGQAVAILSWSRYTKRAGENIEDLTSKVRGVPYLGQAIAGAGEVIKASSLLVYGSGVAYTNSFMVVANTMDAAYSGAQQAFNLALGVSTPKGAVYQTVKQVVQLNAPGAEVLASSSDVSKDPFLYGNYWNDRRKFVTTWGGHKDQNGNDPGGRARMASMINDGARAQPFTVDRDHDVGNPLSFYLYIARSKTHKSGGGQIAKDEGGHYYWSAADSIQTSVQMRKFGLFGGWRTLYSNSWGWGGAFSSPNESIFDYYQNDPVRWQGWQDPQVNPQAQGNSKNVQMVSYPAYRGAWSNDARGMNKVVNEDEDSRRIPTDFVPVPGVGRAAEGGIAHYRDLDWDQRMDSKKGDMTDETPRYVVVVNLPKNRVRDSVTALGISADPSEGGKAPSLGWMSMRLDTQGAKGGGAEGVRAAAAAQVYFRRPSALWTRADGLDERANLFSPFWSARLVDLDSREKAYILTRYAGVTK
ncbi:pilus assembly protein TadG-related protein [Acidithiobacillus thiooxidans]|uniref:Putative Flp pilus-assembly TadG-like N-terminal domain-containing protein n=1 Tax=Acidithiobacillus thiooxidans TaxID=930 RepID=A0A1C2HXK4_ACITH|nr:pilus assembly protein TadG-related protein [Acidithiobacillus thiooxidans]OCX68491.1 hypothetical protein A6M23_18145 [Acidithiobacillus thiooxidans]OCX87358.1 hypothetical protein A6P08_03480 [Acidithiobacillus thiooxidans]